MYQVMCLWFYKFGINDINDLQIDAEPIIYCHNLGFFLRIMIE